MKYRLLAITMVAFTLVTPGTTGFAQGAPQEADLHSEVAALKQGQEAIRRQLLEIKQLLQQGQRATKPRRPNVAGKVFDLGENPFKGSASASVALLEFTDYQCPFCNRHFRKTQPSIEKDYIDTGKIRFVTFNLPIASLHPTAFKASEATHCAEDQGKFWQMRDRLFAGQKTREPLNAHAAALGLDIAEFEACLSTGKHAAAVRRDMAEAEKAGASGTPSFIVGLIDDKDPGKVRGLKFIRGAQPYATFKRELDTALALDAREKLVHEE